ncbi:MAG: thiamine pyrophosphokinae [Thermoanaerobacterium sp.]|uniref:thiamine diphosphokinase n=1 Tax=Thermoanaerobacterium sp. CMT5567-10 TaxID=3061989 RepID=UPI0024AAA6F5|nr:thiamine diphosphokinase [Thermoanaerobacterium sp. CMT5567-10]MDI3476991.1 thiamine pyrophosphokinae [Thermoanaerobacterium sp.]MDK2806700.1 thiamine pyrophosphokinae [Thermoanaerobacterium sp.]MDN5315987.1 thiamine pyrophosphokinae [Thermoanaerobacterium sp.]WKV09195.1 thiamine diphosphokinase [Thermoanaerobacterium sp. CMT5567-10]WLY85431.1 thiamine diphosphokinase [Thermoanaerobacterium sp. CMT5567-10]
MKTCIISNGEFNDSDYIRELINNCDYVICADGGANIAYKLGIVPNLIIGDLDSADKQIIDYYKKDGVQVDKYPTEKDETDTQLATLKAIELGTDEIIYIASTGSRFDHSIANLSLLLYLLKRNIKGIIASEKNEIHLVDRSLELEGKIGDIVSLIPYSTDVKGIYTDGLYYSLSGQDMSLDMPYGISNVFINNKIKIKIDSGLLLVIKSKD